MCVCVCVRVWIDAYLSNDGNIKSGVSKWQHTMSDYGEMKSVKLTQQVKNNASLFLTVDSDENFALYNSSFNFRKCFINSEIIIIIRGRRVLIINILTITIIWWWWLLVLNHVRHWRLHATIHHLLVLFL